MARMLSVAFRKHSLKLLSLFSRKIHRKLFMSESGIDVYEGPSFLLYDRVHTWDNPCDFIVYYVLAGVECGAR